MRFIKSIIITLLSLSIYLSATIDVGYNTTSAMGGFQFSITEGTIVSASGGAAADAGFTVSASGTTALGFSLTGATIPAGEGILITVEVEGSDAPCIDGVVISDSSGNALDITVDCTSFAEFSEVLGCTDETACNYDSDANTDDGSCDYGSECWDGSFVCDETECPDQPTYSFDVTYNTTSDIGGFQFGVTEGSIVSASGGDATSAGFTVSTSSSTVIGFSLTGGTIPAGTGTLITVEVEGATDPCIDGVVISDSAGSALTVNVDCTSFEEFLVVTGCTDDTACNYDSDATDDDGSCVFAEENYDCDGNCTADLDCNGDCGGSAVEDECGVCGGDGIADGACDCDGNIFDSCGECGGTDDCITSISFGTVTADSAEILIEVGDSDVGGFQFDVNGVSIASANGGAAADAGFTVSTSASTVIGFSLTGSTIPAGTSGILTELSYSIDSPEACLGDVVISDAFGSAIPVTVGDCADLSGFLSATLDVTYNTTSDIGGFQFNVTEGTIVSASGGAAADAGFTVSASGTTVIGFSLTGGTIPAGSGTLITVEVEGAADPCIDGVVISDPTGSQISVDVGCSSIEEVLTGCTVDTACNYDSDATEDDGSCVFAEENYDCDGNCTADLDCNGDCGGTAVEDECGVCGGDGIADGACDCDGNIFDSCGECGGADACVTSISFGNVNDQLLEILIEVGDSDVGGFQFDVSGISITGSGGGLAADAGFTVSTSASTVIGFSLTGGTISAGISGILTELSYSADSPEACLDGVVISDASGSAIPATVGDCVTVPYVNDGCTDLEACNYDPNATEDDGSCEYAEENYDCEGNCLVFDSCGECGGDGSSCTVLLSFGNVTSDEMEILIDTPVDVGGFQFNINSLATVAGASGGIAESAGFTVSVGNNTVIGFSLTGGTISGGTSNILTVLSYVCDYEGLNEACIDGVVFSDPSGIQLPSQVIGDCVQVGEEVVLGCTDSLACNFDESANQDDGSCVFAEENYDCDGNCTADLDCNGDCGGSAEVDECNVCGGDNTSCADECGVPNGDNTSCADDCGVPNGGNADLDGCGVCFGDNSSCSGCTDETASNYDDSATIDDNSCIYSHFYVDIENTGVTQSVIFTNLTGLDPGDEIGIFDANALTNFGNCDSEYGELLVGQVTLTGEEQAQTVAISSIDFCSFPDGYQLPGFVEGNPIILKVWDESAGVEYDASFEIAAGSPNFEETSFVTISEITLLTYGCTDDNACNYDDGANADDGSCVFAEENYDCDGNCTADLDCNGDCGGGAVVDECGECGGDGSSCTTEIANSIDLSSNWNWISFNVYQDDMTLANVFSDIAIANDGVDNVNFIKSQVEGTATWYETFGWFGALADGVLTNEQMYQVYMNNSATLNFTGTPVIPSETPVNLTANWNWIGYLPQSSSSLADAFSSIAIANDGIDNVNFIKSQIDGTATWYETFGWFGALADYGLYPNEGYQVYMNNPATLYYPDDVTNVVSFNDDGYNLERDNTKELLGWTFNPREYEFNGTITFEANNFDDHEGDILAAFVDGELRGVTECVYFPFGDKNIYIMQVYSNELNGEKLTFKLYDVETGQTYEYLESVIFESDMIIGDGFATFNLSQTESDIIIPSETSLSSAYPNPFNPTTSLDYSLANDSHVSIAVYDISGQLVETLVDNYKGAGYYKVVWNAYNYSSGIYFIGMNIEGSYYTQKLMLVK